MSVFYNLVDSVRDTPADYQLTKTLGQTRWEKLT